MLWVQTSGLAGEIKTIFKSLTEVDPDDDAMYTLITMIKTLVQFRLSSGPFQSGRTKQERERFPGQQAVCASQAAQTICVRAPVSGWSFAFFILRLSSASSPPILSLSVSRSRSLFAERRTWRHVHARHAQKRSWPIGAAGQRHYNMR